MESLRKICSPIRTILGLGLIGYGVYSGNYWFFLGIIPLLMGVTKFCPSCAISGKCDPFTKK